MTSKVNKILVKELTKSFDNKLVLKGINLDIESGKSLVILGGSGSGKSVLIKTIAALIKPTSGTIKIDNQEILQFSQENLDKLMFKIGFLFQGGALFDSMTVWENIAFRYLGVNKFSKEKSKSKAIKKMQAVGLHNSVADLYPSELSGGMQKRVALARAIATDPEIIFFDEPTTGLDPIMADVINELIIKNSKELGATTVTITHDIHSVRRIADKIAMLYDGRIIWTGSVSEMDKSDNPYLKQFVNGEAKGPIKLFPG